MDILNKFNKLRSRKIILLLFDFFLCFAIGISFLMVGSLRAATFGKALLMIAPLMLSVAIARFSFHCYRQVWRYATAYEYLTYVVADFLACMVYVAVSRLLFPSTMQIMFWRTLSVIAVNCLASLSARLAYQGLYDKQKAEEGGRVESEETRGLSGSGQGCAKNKINIAIVGAGSVGTLLARELQINSRAHYNPVCFIDKDVQKIGNSVAGLKVYPEDGIVARLKNMPVQEIVIALPGLSGEKRQELYEMYVSSGCKVKIYEAPITEDSGLREARKPVMREFKIEDLLFREPVKINSTKTARFYKNTTILITGGGGTIGSEICRQLAKFQPKELIVFDIYENNAYDIQQELRLKYGKRLNFAVEIASIREARRVDEVLAKYRPDIVIHAAAHKHVPLMELNCAEAVKNNVFGTLNAADAAEKYGVKKFIMISTDKAVNPTNVMGASKRMCEMIVQSRNDTALRRADGKPATEFTAVRFGNVLGSSGSVIPLFKSQIASGGPVTITDRRIIRYFMTVPEAAQLVLEAGSMAKDGELYVLDMGKPVKILKLAEDMIRLSGFEPYRDIEIRETGLREGEKLYEELLVKDEELDKTENELIFIERDRGLSRAEVQEKLDILKEALEDGGNEAIKDALRAVVPTYHRPEEVNMRAALAQEMKDSETA